MLQQAARRIAPRAFARRFSTAPAVHYDVAAVPVIDLGPLRASPVPPPSLVDEVASACERWGFFQVVNHGVNEELRARAEEQQRAFFVGCGDDVKQPLRRTADNSRGWYNDELTKRKRDWKEGLDFGSTPLMAWSVADEDVRNGTLDGYNRFPPASALPEFRRTLLEYYDELAELSARLTRLFALGLDMPADHFEPVLRRGEHTSYLRLNWYPPCPDPGPPPETLCISPHKDAGFLTVLAQDITCHSLQVRDRAHTDEWATVRPEPNAYTINTGDMAQIYSNNRYHAPEHRVLTHLTQDRISAPFFYNPSYHADVAPLPSLGKPQYDTLKWGYFRALRFAGDFADFGTPEIQISDFDKGSGSWHVANQARFMAEVDFNRAFDCNAYRHLLTTE